MLLAANAFLIFNIIRQDRTRSYIDIDEVTGAAELLTLRGLTVDPDNVPLEKFKAPVYESLFNDEYYTAVAETVTGSRREMLLSLPNGGFSITAENGGLVEFDTEFGFYYAKNDKSGVSAYTDITASDFADRAAKNEALSGAYLKSISRKATAFLDSRVPSDYTLCAKITDSFEDTETGLAYLLAAQMLGGHEVYSHYAVCVFDKDELVNVYGRWYFAPFDEDYGTELVDQVNILFYDLWNIRSEASSRFILQGDGAEDYLSVPGAVALLADEDVHTETAEAEDLGEIPAVIGMRSCYATYWSADKTAVYFIPAWQIDHEDGRSIVYNATNGTVYASNR